MSAKNRVGLIGAGLMGQPMGLNWLKKGFSLTVVPHKNMARIAELEKNGAKVVQTYAELAENSDFIVFMLPTSHEVESVAEEIMLHLSPHHLVIDMSTSDPLSTQGLFKKFKSRALRFFDAPVTGGVKGAVEGSLTLFIGGPMEYFAEAKDMLGAVSKIQTHFGEAGKGHVAKIINNFVCIGNLAVFAEALPLAAKLGLSTRDIFQTLSSGTAASKMLDLYGVQILNGDFAPRFKLAHAFKDLQLAKNLTQKLGAGLPVLNGTIEDFKRAMDSDLGEENVAALIKVIEAQLGSKFRSQA